jgi:hypothetical protein
MKNVIKGELPFVNDASHFHILTKIQYTMLKIPQTEEWLVEYKMPFAKIMEPWDTFIGKVMRQPNVQTRLLIRAEPSEVKLEGWGDNALKGTRAYMQQREWERIEMSLLFVTL